jgi:hypothetical protein
MPSARRVSSMTAVHDGAIVDKSAWTSDSLGGRAGLVRALDATHLAAIRELVEKLRGAPRDEISAKQFDHPGLTPLLSEIREEIDGGTGAAIVTGIDPNAWSSEDLELIFWGIGAHLGDATVQSRRADRIGYVRHEPDDPVARGYRGSGELVLHTDSRPVIALMCVSSAAQGGATRLASAMTIHNIIRRERPDLLPPLYRGYPYFSAEIDSMLPAIPLFSDVDGVLSCYFFEDHMRRAAHAAGEQLPDDLEEALAFFNAVAQRPDVCLEFMLAPGEILISNNFVILHARTAFEDSERRRRLLLRLWLEPSQPRPTVPELRERSRRFDALFDPRAEKSAGAAASGADTSARNTRGV